MDQPELIILFFGIAFLYSSIGFGGGSSYIAILALFGVEYDLLRVLALLCNITVVSFAVYFYTKNDLMDWKKVLPIVLISVPMAFVGGRILLPKESFLLVLGMALLLAGIAILSKKAIKTPVNSVQLNTKPMQFGIGGGIGFFSGLVGIGGGIFLSPLLHLLNWDTPKRIAATAGFFILVNSIAGLLGQYTLHQVQLDWKFAIILMTAVAMGGQLGTRVGIKVLSEMVVRRLTAVLVIYVGVKLLWENGFIVAVLS